MTDYYVDPNYAGGTRNGQAATPWQSLADTVTNTPWTVIDAALVTADVSVWFSARGASSDVDQASTVGLEILRTDSSTHRVTLDGMTKYNTSDASPSWAAYTGNSRFAITTSSGSGISTTNFSTPWTHRDYVTVRGFKIVATNQPVVLVNTSSLIFEYNEVSAQSGAAVGPGVIYQHRPLADTDHSHFASNIVIRNNSIHDTFGEGIYISGNGGDGGSGQGVPPGDTANTQTQDDVLIESNTITRPGFYGGEGDGIDVKEGNTNLRIRQNTINLTGIAAGRAITVESADLIEGNFCINVPTNAIAVTAGYNGTFGRDRLVIRNNVAVGGANSCLKLDSSDATSSTYWWHNTKVQNNTFLKPASSGTDHIVYIDGHDNVIFQNNILIGRDTFQCLRYDASTVTFLTHDYNSYSNSTSDFSWVVGFSGGSTYDKSQITSWEAHSIVTAPLLVSESSPYLIGNFQLQSGSPCKDTATTIATFSNDLSGNSRVSGQWDMGALELGAIAGALRLGVMLR